jgi:hypothetical protein
VLVKARLKPMQYRPGLLDGFLAKTGPVLAELIVIDQRNIRIGKRARHALT